MRNLFLATASALLAAMIGSAGAASASPPPLPNPPDLSLVSGGSGFAPSVPHGYDQLVTIFGSNHGGAVADATVTITFPTGFTLGPHGVYRDEGGPTVPLTCAGPSPTYVCHYGPIAAGHFITFGIDVAAAASLRVDMPAETMHVDLEPVGTADANPADNTTDLHLIIEPVSDLFTTLTLTKRTAPVGTRVVVTATVTNKGPDTGRYVSLVVTVRPSGSTQWGRGYRVADENGHTWGPNSDSEQVASGDLPVGASFTRTLTVTGTSAATLLVAASAAPGITDGLDPVRQCGDPACTYNQEQPLAFVAPPHTSPPQTPQPGSSDALANTGPPTHRLLFTGLLLLLAGIALDAQGRRRPTSR